MRTFIIQQLLRNREYLTDTHVFMDYKYAYHFMTLEEAIQTAKKLEEPVTIIKVYNANKERYETH